MRVGAYSINACYLKGFAAGLLLAWAHWAWAAESVSQLAERHVRERQSLNSGYQSRVDEVSKEYQKALRLNLDNKGPYPSSQAAKYSQLGSERSKAMTELNRKQEQERENARVAQLKTEGLKAEGSASSSISSSQAPGSTRSPSSVMTFDSTPSQPEVVIDGSDVPREIEFPGPARR